MSYSYAEIVEGVFGGEGCVQAPRVDSVICLDPSCRVRSRGEVEYCYPVMDGSVEPLDHFAEALLKLIELRRRGLRVYVHCVAGCGRTGTLISAYLILEKGFSADEAIALYRWKRGCGPETWEQHELLYALDYLVRRGGVELALRVLGGSQGFGEFLARSREV